MSQSRSKNCLSTSYVQIINVYKDGSPLAGTATLRMATTGIPGVHNFTPAGGDTDYHLHSNERRHDSVTCNLIGMQSVTLTHPRVFVRVIGHMQQEY